MADEDDKVKISRTTARKLAKAAELPEELTDRERAELLDKVAKKLREDNR